jgi:hypothetical protein
MITAQSGLFSLSDRMLRQFAALWIVFFGLIAARQEFHDHRREVAITIAALALTVGPLGLLFPRLIRPIFIAWMRLAQPIGWVVSRMVLGTIFYGLFTPVACVFRLIGRDVLILKPRPEAASYWVPKPNAGARDQAQYLRQF